MGAFAAADTSNEIIEPVPRYGLTFDDQELGQLVALYSDEAIKHVPGLRYWALGEDRQMNRSPNICGHQQRAWEFYWCLRVLQESKGISLGIGTGGIGAPGMITTDKFNAGETPHAVRYPHGNGNSHMRLDADEVPWSFFDNKFGAVIFNHSFEHLANQFVALSQALRVTKQGGYVCILQPDMTYSKRGSIDPTHTTEWCADLFVDWLRGIQAALKEGHDENTQGFTILEHNTLDNAFSFDTVLQKL